MAHVSVAPEYQDISEEAIRQLRESGVDLTDYSTGLLLLAVEAWIEENPPELRALTPGGKRDVIFRVLSESTREPHIFVKRKKGEKVYFYEWLWALSVSGREVIKDIIDKGF